MKLTQNSIQMYINQRYSLLTLRNFITCPCSPVTRLTDTFYQTMYTYMKSGVNGCGIFFAYKVGGLEVSDCSSGLNSVAINFYKYQ